MDSETKKLTLEDLGCDSFFESNQAKIKLDGFAAARVTAEHRGAYGVKNAEGEYLAKITGKLMHIAESPEDYPAVGDWVAIEKSGEKTAVIRSILPRKTLMKRNFGDKNRLGKKNETQVLAANIDVAYIVQSVGRDFSLNRFERYFAIAKAGGVQPAVILNKIDLISREELNGKLDRIRRRFGDVSVFATSMVSGEGLEQLKKNILPGKTYCFLGSSGVGKSTLINFLLGQETIKTDKISDYSAKGKHVTTKRQMYFLPNGGIVIDNPGVREVGMADSRENVENLFGEMMVLARNCKYSDCTHIHEPGCAVLAAVESGKLDEDKYQNFINLVKEIEYHESNAIERKQKNRQFGKFINKAKKNLKEIGHKDY